MIYFQKNDDTIMYKWYCIMLMSHSCLPAYWEIVSNLNEIWRTEVERTSIFNEFLQISPTQILLRFDTVPIYVFLNSFWNEKAYLRWKIEHLRTKFEVDLWDTKGWGIKLKQKQKWADEKGVPQIYYNVKEFFFVRKKSFWKNIRKLKI